MTTGERVSPLEHLAELDKLLRDIQTELMPDREPAQALAGVAGPPPPVAPPATDPPQATRPPTTTRPPVSDRPSAPPPASEPQPQALAELAARLLASTRELLAGYERLLVGSAPPPAPRTARRRPGTPDVTLAAGPFPSLEAVREFERAVSRLPRVRDVAVRGYEGADRAIIEVRLDPP